MQLIISYCWRVNSWWTWIPMLTLLVTLPLTLNGTGWANCRSVHVNACVHTSQSLCIDYFTPPPPPGSFAYHLHRPIATAATLFPIQRLIGINSHLYIIYSALLFVVIRKPSTLSVRVNCIWIIAFASQRPGLSKLVSTARCIDSTKVNTRLS